MISGYPILLEWQSFDHLLAEEDRAVQDVRKRSEPSIISSKRKFSPTLGVKTMDSRTSPQSTRQVEQMTTQKEMIGHFSIVRKRAAEAASLSDDATRQWSQSGSERLQSQSTILLCTRKNTSIGSRGEDNSPDINRMSRGDRLESGPLRTTNTSNNISLKQHYSGWKSRKNDDNSISDDMWNNLGHQMRMSELTRLWKVPPTHKSEKSEGNLRLAGDTSNLKRSGNSTRRW